MPGRDGTGPKGLGSRTGWGLGNCAPAVSNTGQPISKNLFLLSRLGGWIWNATLGNRLGRGRGRGCGGGINR